MKNKIIINSNRLIRIMNKKIRNHINKMVNKIILSLLPYWWLYFLLANYILIYQKGYGKYSKKKVKKQIKSIYLVSPEYHYYDMNYPEYGEFNLYSTNFKKELLALIKRHPMRQNQIIETFSTPYFKEEDIIKNLKSLESQCKIKNIIYNDNIFWQLYI